MDDYGLCPSYIQVITTQPTIYIEQANIWIAYIGGLASGLLALMLHRWR